MDSHQMAGMPSSTEPGITKVASDTPNCRYSATTAPSIVSLPKRVRPQPMMDCSFVVVGSLEVRAVWAVPAHAVALAASALRRRKVGRPTPAASKPPSTATT